ncbi:unnamed protein product [Cuscuta campestris]|uniref:CCHC-type domain-containing protein n=1 Tax=Cuscuta campestris TaxID=132261 RepID=A0A484KME0_9ASTE|nr:unnamed protein product [Cuscuta campestris]
MRIYIHSTNFQLWLVIKNGEEVPMNKVGDKLIPKTEDEFDAEDIKKVENYAKAINMLYCALNPDDYRKISCCTTAKEMWDKLEVTYEGTDQVREAKTDFLTQEYEMFRMKEHEKIDDMFDRFSKIVNDLHALKKTYTDKDLVRKILRSLTSEWRSKADSIYESIATSNVTIDGLRGNLKTYESTILNSSLNDQRKGMALKAVKESTMDDSSDDDEVKLVMKKFFKLLRKKEKVEDGLVCYGCGEARHIKNKCPKSGRNARHFKRQRAYISWGGDSGDESTDQDEDETANLCLMAHEDQTDDVQEEKLVDASTCAPSTSAAQVVSVARPVDEGFVLVDDKLFLEQPSFMQKAQVHKLRNLLPEGYQLSYRATWKNIISLHAGTTIGIHYHSIKDLGEFSIHPFKVLFFETYEIMPGQLTTNGHRMLSSFINVCQFLCIPLSLRLFDHMFDVWPGSKETLGFVIVSSHQGRAFLSGLPPSNRGGKEKYVSIKFPPGDFPFAQNAWGEKTQVVKFNSKFSIPHIEDVGQIGQEWATRLIKTKSEEKAWLEGMMVAYRKEAQAAHLKAEKTEEKLLEHCTAFWKLNTKHEGLLKASKEADAQAQEKIRELEGEKAKLEEEAAQSAAEIAELKAKHERERSDQASHAAAWAPQEPEQFASRVIPDRETGI